MTVKQTHGKARYKDGTLTITMTAKRGEKTVENVVTYTVKDIRPDPQVADPAYTLTKEDGESYDVWHNEWGPCCSCPHATFRGSNTKIVCKHVAACQAVGLLPKVNYPGEKK